ncbi:hypothetical protein JCM10914A_00520 [Paenibacillus sp. JCM 10914]|uniref:peptidylprolyl isomerase n=1 Tax=Paenibacillus sp. JCM 10914 TaxID=1236974 RepID=UPI0003CCA1E5|nr:peptidylprolyl isomerase [Paenibacillus sp. JCM 10914]GAE08538.1 foldase protein PrsA precursor [Paenibacillus sp. JCM 10914]
MKDNDLQPNHPGQPEDEQGQAQERENNLHEPDVTPETESNRIDSSLPEGDEPSSEEDGSVDDRQSEVNEQPEQEQYLPPTMVADHAVVQNEQHTANGGGGGGKGWMIASLVLAAALIVVLIVPPFAKGSGNEAIAKVNDAKITKDMLYEELVTVGGKQTLDGMISQELIRQEVNKKSITVTEEEIDQEIEALKGSFPSEDQFNMALQQSGMTLEELRTESKKQIEQKKLMADKIEVTDEEISAFYDQYKNNFATPEQVRASHILVETEEEAKEIVQQLKDGADFAQIASEKNQDATKDTGGDLDFFGRGEMDPAFEEAAFSMKKDEISDPVKTSFGYHVIKLTDRKEAINPTLEEKKEEIRNQIESQKVYQGLPAYIQELKEGANVTNTIEEKEAAAAETPDAEATP